MNQPDLTLPLHGIRVLELGHTITGPTCGRVTLTRTECAGIDASINRGRGDIFA